MMFIVILFEGNRGSTLARLKLWVKFFSFATLIRVPCLKAKMQEYIENGVSLGWLIDRPNRTVYVYRPNQEVQILENPEQVSGDPELPGFRLLMSKIW